MKKTKRYRLKRFWLRCKIAWKILFEKEHGVVVYLDYDDLVHLIEHDELKKDKEIKMGYYGMSFCHAQRFLKIVGNEIDETDIIINKGIFEAKVVEDLSKNKSHE